MSQDSEIISRIVSEEFVKAVQTKSTEIVRNVVTRVSLTNNGEACSECLGIFLDHQLMNLCPDFSCNRRGYCEQKDSSGNRLRCTPHTGSVNDDPRRKLVARYTGNRKRYDDTWDGTFATKWNESALCHSSCVQKIKNLNLENKVIVFLGEESEQDIKTRNEVVVERSIGRLKNEVKGFSELDPETGEPTGIDISANKESIDKIVQKVDIKQIIKDTKLLNSVQILEIDGPGTFQNIDMKLMVNAVMVSIHNQSSQEISDIRGKIREQIQAFIEKTASNAWKQAWERSKGYFIKMGTALLVMLVFTAILILWRAYTGRG